MSLNDFSTITVSTSAPALTQQGFGTLGILAAHSKYSDLVKVYTDLDQLATDGFEMNSAAYVAVQKAFSQSPRVERVKLLRGTHPATVQYTLTPVNVADHTEYAIDLELEGHAPVTISYTSGTGATGTDITAGLHTAVGLVNSGTGPLNGVTASTGATCVITAPSAGKALWAHNWRGDRLSLKDTTPDPGVTTDLDAVRLVDDDWYGLGLADSNSVVCATAAAGWIETLSSRKIAAFNTSDTNATDLSTTTDLASVLGSNSYQRSLPLFDLDTTKGFSGIASLANLFPFDPGQGPFAGGVLNGRTLGGVTADALSPTQHDNLRTKGYSIYITTAGINHVLGGEAGGGEWIDFTRFVDWYVARLQEALAALQFNNRRVPYDARGISMVESVLRAQLQAGIDSGGIANPGADGPPSISVPKLSDTSSQDRAARILNGCRTAFEYAGAIQKVGVLITVTE